MSGWYLMHRGWMDTPELAGPFCRRAAWAWMIERACWKPTPFNVNGHIVTLQPGQFCTSRAQLAEAWGWSASAVERFLTRLKTGQMIEQATGQGRSIITICNYAKYQARDDEAGQATGQDAGQRSDSDRTAKETSKEAKKEKNDYGFSGRVIRVKPDDLAKWQRAYPDVDLIAALQSRDDWLTTQDEAARKRWFLSTSNWLRRQQEQAKPAAPKPAMGVSGEAFFGGMTV